MFIVQNEAHPGAMQSALFDLMRGGVDTVRVCCAYMSMAGSQILFDGIERSAAAGNHRDVQKTMVTSLDFGLTDPEALRFWTEMENSRVFVAGAALLEAGRLTPYAAFHPKLYVVGRPNGSVGSLVGSANLTNRGLTINAEVGWLEMEHAAPEPLDDVWAAATGPTIALTPELLARYRELYRRAPRERGDEELEPLPPPQLGALRRYRAFADAGIEPVGYTQMWVQSRGMQGGAGTQLEIPRGSHRFFGADYAGYDFERVEHIAEPVLVSGRREWPNRPVTWHGDNRMERINLPSAAMGGFAYENSLILFRRIMPNTFELRVYPWNSDPARAYVEAARREALLFRVGRNSNRLAGLLP